MFPSSLLCNICVTVILGLVAQSIPYAMFFSFLFYYYFFICIYFMLHLLLGRELLFLQFLVGCLFLLCSFLFWFRNNRLFLSRVISVYGRESSCTGWSCHGLCKSGAASWELYSPGCAQWPESPHLNPGRKEREYIRSHLYLNTITGKLSPCLNELILESQALRDQIAYLFKQFCRLPSKCPSLN